MATATNTTDTKSTTSSANDIKPDHIHKIRVVVEPNTVMLVQSTGGEILELKAGPHVLYTTVDFPICHQSLGVSGKQFPVGGYWKSEKLKKEKQQGECD